MAFKERFEKSKEELLKDKNICKENRQLFEKFFKFQEVKLKRMNGLQSLDEPTYKTLYTYVYRFKIVNNWFNNKPLSNLTKEQFEKVFNDLCDGKIKNSKGQPIKDIDSFVFKIFKSKLFKLAGLSDIVEESLEFYKSNNDPHANFIDSKDMNLIIDHIPKPKMKLLITLAFDIGENVSSLLLLKKRDCRKQFNEVTKEYEYLIHLKKETLKRSRLERTEPTRLSKTNELLDFVLKNLNDNDYIFHREDKEVYDEKGNIIKNIPFSLRNAEIFFERIVTRLNIKTIPLGKTPSLKDIRSSMSCDCLKLGWSLEEINSRLGHSVNSKVLKPYVSFLALDKSKPKIREYKENVQGLNDKIQEQRDINILLSNRLKEQDEKIKLLLEKYNSVQEKYNEQHEFILDFPLKEINKLIDKKIKPLV